MGKNILGYPSLKNRIGSFFKDEAVIGSFLNGFIFILIGYLFKTHINNSKNIKKVDSRSKLEIKNEL